MRAARLLQILLILQNRGRQTSGQLAKELEVAPRTILRDVDAMTEAGLPIIVHQGQGGGIELGFNYRTRLTGLSRDEAAALGLVLCAQTPMVAALGLEDAAQRARAKLIESLPDKPRLEATKLAARFELNKNTNVEDPRVRAMAHAVRAATIVRLRFASKTEQQIHPIKLTLDDTGWCVRDGLTAKNIPIADWGRLNISAMRFSSDTND
ncbi:helix-turn-helix transcriptional regulator [Maritalea mediterranea]|uniref:HTH domain-containing protein n=1 Tax=Maritalea mediterranea TaxID=2909667 RepID=A0ABS9E801_9HYPH|nr:HTH domain-containing protein [Maritalea mediterranea]MCF4097576.1 HTH domain-containing protein [Maritalea mediterranea]